MNAQQQTALEHNAQLAEFQRQHRTGLLTLLFTDIVGSGKIKQTLGDSAGVALIQQNHATIREILGRSRGQSKNSELLVIKFSSFFRA